MAESQPEEETKRKEQKCTCHYGCCICSEKHRVIAIMRSKRFRDKFGSLVDLALTEDDDFTPDRSNEAVAKMESEAYIMCVYKQKIPHYPPISDMEQPMPKRHIDVYREIHKDKFSLKEFYSLSSEDLKKLDTTVWKERERYVKRCEENYIAGMLGATHQGPERRRELYSIAVGVMLDYVLEEAENKKANPLSSLNCPVHALRAMTPFFERLTEAGMDRILRMVELDKRDMGIQREVCTLCLCYINHPKAGMVLAEALGKILLNCEEEDFPFYGSLMKEIFCYVCPIPGVHMYVDPDIFSTLIKYHCIALLLSSSKMVNREIVDNLKIARAFDSVPIAEKAFLSNRVEVDSLYEPNFIIFMTDVGYPVLPGDARLKRLMDMHEEFNKECLKLGMEKDMMVENDQHYKKRISKELKRWKKVSQEDPELVERKKDMDLLADCLTRSVETWIWDWGEGGITSKFMTVPEKPYRFAEGLMPELAELVEKNNPKPIDPEMVKDLLERTKHRAPKVVAAQLLAQAQAQAQKTTTTSTTTTTTTSTKPEKDKAKKSTKSESAKNKAKKTEPEAVKSKSTVKPEPEKSKSKSTKQGTAGKTKAEKSAGKSASSKATSDQDSSSPSPTQDETDESKPLKVKQLQRCGFCNRQELPEAKFQKCARCRKTRYCSKECQHQHWRGGHKDECQEKKSKKTDES
ncbi:uncharacterized protein LOC144926260 [Branchiostoma floridae x Branchiostoma belcheri]